MAKSPRYRLLFSPEALDHLRGLTAREQSTIIDTVARQLSHQPAIETRNRKLMQPNEVGTWELRIGNFRVYYDIGSDPEPCVSVRAIGVKIGAEVRIAGEVVDL